MKLKQLFESPDMIDTPAFKAWFGNSKVVDKNGKPLRVYHGSNTFAGKTFHTSTEKKNRVNNITGFYFASTIDRAEEFVSFYDMDAGRSIFRDNAEIIPVYLSLQNPFIPGVTPIGPALENAYRKALIGKNSHIKPDNTWHIEKLTTLKSSGKPSASALRDDGDAFRDVIIDGGYDGYRDGQDWVAFHPNQIKSAIGNKGKYDISNDDITESTR